MAVRMGRRTRILSPDKRERLNNFRVARRLSMPLLNQTMDSPFRWETLQRALNGKPVWDLNHQFIIDWIAAHLVEPVPTLDAKAASAGEREREP